MQVNGDKRCPRPHKYNTKMDLCVCMISVIHVNAHVCTCHSADVSLCSGYMPVGQCDTVIMV